MKRKAPGIENPFDSFHSSKNLFDKKDRLWLAGIILQSLLSAASSNDREALDIPRVMETVIDLSIRMADQMLEKLEKPN